MGQIYKFVFVLVLVLSTNFIAWLCVRIFHKRNIPLRAIGRNSIIGMCAASVGFWSVDIFKWLLY
jgi:hypothetical protein